MKVYNKLVRDEIPQIIREAGKVPVVKMIEDKKEILRLLEAKIYEELKEYEETGELLEIADLIEVLFAISEIKGTSREELLKIATQKSTERGGFKEGIFLVGVEELPNT